jgi:hypothetical protein
MKAAMHLLGAMALFVLSGCATGTGAGDVAPEPPSGIVILSIFNKASTNIPYIGAVVVEQVQAAEAGVASHRLKNMDADVEDPHAPGTALFMARLPAGRYNISDLADPRDGLSVLPDAADSMPGSFVVEANKMVDLGGLVLRTVHGGGSAVLMRSSHKSNRSYVDLYLPEYRGLYLNEAGSGWTTPLNGIYLGDDQLVDNSAALAVDGSEFEDAATVYVLRDFGVKDASWPVRVLIDGSSKAELWHEMFTRLRVRPGWHELMVEAPVFTKFPSLPLGIDLEAGKSYYLVNTLEISEAYYRGPAILFTSKLKPLGRDEAATRMQNFKEARNLQDRGNPGSSR